MDYQDVTPQEANFIEEFSRTIESALNELLGRYKKLNEDYSSEKALNELTSLDDQVTQLTEKISELCTVDFDIKCLDRDQEKLLDLQQELKIIILGVKDLKQNVDNLQVLSNEILPDPQLGDFLEITGISNRIRENVKTWSVTVKSLESNKGYFRNVDIVSLSGDVENPDKSILAHIKLIQPNTEVKVELKYLGEDYPKVQAFIQQKPVSNEYQGFQVVIQSVVILEDGSINLRVQNTSDEKLEKNFINIGSDLISNEFVLNQRQTKLVPIYPPTNSSILACANYVAMKFISVQFAYNIQSSIIQELTPNQQQQFLLQLPSDSIQDLLETRKLVLNPQP